MSLFKALIFAEQVTYERIHGRVDSTHELLQLVWNDPWITWFHPFTLLVVRINELLDDESALLLVEVEQVLRDVRSLLRPSKEGDGFARSYYEAMKREPEIVFAHIEVYKRLVRIAA